MQRRLFVLALVLCLALIGVSFVSAGGGKGPTKCTTIQSGTLFDSAGNVIVTGYDMYGYNYQAKMFNGLYGNFSRPPVPVTGGDNLAMKWNDAWMSNVDCDGDGKLDRHFGYPTYKGSGAWLTNHMSGEYELDGQIIHWTYFVKIVAAPEDAILIGGNWVTADGHIVIGPAIWGDFATIQEVYNDPGADAHGLTYKSAVAPGLGVYKP